MAAATATNATPVEGAAAADAATGGTVPAETVADATGAVLTAGAEVSTGTAIVAAADGGKAEAELEPDAELEAAGAAADEQAASSVLTAARHIRPPRRAAADRRPTT